MEQILNSKHLHRLRKKGQLGTFISTPKYYTNWRGEPVFEIALSKNITSTMLSRSIKDHGHLRLEIRYIAKSDLKTKNRPMSPKKGINRLTLLMYINDIHLQLRNKRKLPTGMVCYFTKITKIDNKKTHQYTSEPKPEKTLKSIQIIDEQNRIEMNKIETGPSTSTCTIHRPNTVTGSLEMFLDNISLPTYTLMNRVMTALIEEPDVYLPIFDEPESELQPGPPSTTIGSEQQ